MPLSKCRSDRIGSLSHRIWLFCSKYGNRIYTNATFQPLNVRTYQKLQTASCSLYFRWTAFRRNKKYYEKKCRAKHRAFSAILGIKKNTIENTVRKYLHSKHTLLFTKFDNVHFILFFCCAPNKNDINKTAKFCRADDIIL